MKVLLGSRTLATAYVVCLIAVIFLTLLHLPFTLEDAYITLHYSRTFAHGARLGTWNLGEAPVEGFSSFLWTVLIGYAQKFKISPFIFAKALGFTSFISIPVMCFVASVRSEKTYDYTTTSSSCQFASAAIISSLYLPFVFYSVSGMEVTFFSAQMMAAILLPFLFRGNILRGIFAVVLAIALVLTRPEGLLVAAVVNGYWVFYSLRKKVRLTWPILGIICAVLSFVALTVFRFHQFGELVPNTYFAKATGGSAIHRLWLGIRYLAHFCLGVVPIFFVAVGGIILFRRKLFSESLNIFLIVFLAIYTCYIVKVGGDPESAFPLWRQFSHIAPVWMLVLAGIICSLTKSHVRSLVFALLIIIATDVWIAVGHWALLVRNPIRFTAHNGLFKKAPPADYLIWLKQFTTPDTLSAVSLAGQWPYVVPGKYIDMLGLNDSYIAKHGRIQQNSDFVDSKSDMQYVLSKRPDIIDGYVSARELLAGDCPADFRGDRADMVMDMANDQSFKDDYYFVRNGPYSLMNRAIFFRKEFADALQHSGLDLEPVSETALYKLGCASR